MKTLNLECVRLVEEFLDEKDPDIENAFIEAEEWKPSEKYLRSDLKDWLAQADIKPARSREFTVSFLGFVEYDSGNIGHAGAYYAYAATGPEKLIDKLREAL